MESYIVRIYRREQECSSKLVGIVEDVQQGYTQSFSNVKELWHILREAKSNPSQQNK